MKFAIAYDPDPRDPNPHPWVLAEPVFATAEEALARCEEPDEEDEFAPGRYDWEPGTLVLELAS